MKVNKAAQFIITRMNFALVLLIALNACSSADKLQTSAAPELPYRTWEIGLFAPNYMEVWVESVDVVDRRGLTYEHVHGGTSSITNPSGNRGNPAGWPQRPGAGKSMPMTGVDLPEHILVRWQSLAEPQTYIARIDVPDWVRYEMVRPHEAYCRFDGKNIQDYRKVVTFGLAPGGIVKAWLIGDCSEPMEIGRFEGVIDPNGPYEGKSGGNYYRPPSEHAQHYLDTHEIPYNSW
ncbi:DUF2931 family protein [Halopseudomonas sabulinigri]|uniref:DUF2931 family protein n=1 Tax=Halopseudomonas sabulinigri TaxID=472181 RepID=A0ABP9ZPJ5_9GAMM